VLRKTRNCVAVVAAASLVGACASSSADIAPSYVSPIQYQSYTCPQLSEEAQRVASAVAQTSGAQDKQRTNDAVATGVAIVLFWPAAFLVGGDKQTAAQLAQLKGQFDAIQQASIRKNCGLKFETRQQ